MNKKRVLIATALGVLFGLVCAYGASTSIGLAWLILALVFYNRVLLGFVVGIADGINVHPVLRGGVLGAVVSLGIVIFAGSSGALLLGAGIAYGIITDVVVSRVA